MSLSEHNTCSVVFDNDEVVFELHDNQLFIIGVIGSAAGREALYARFLQADYLGAETGFGAIGLDTERGEFVLHRNLVGNLEYGEFEAVVTLFIQVLRYWKSFLQDSGPVDAAGDATDGLDLLSHGAVPM